MFYLPIDWDGARLLTGGDRLSVQCNPVLRKRNGQTAIETCLPFCQFVGFGHISRPVNFMYIRFFYLEDRAMVRFYSACSDSSNISSGILLATDQYRNA